MPPTVTLATANLLHGRSMADGQISAGRLAEAVALLSADVLGLQEVDRGQPRSGAVDQTAAVAEAMGAAEWRFAPALVGTPGGSWRAAVDDDARSGSACYGIGLVSRLPVVSWHVTRLAAARVRSPIMLPGGGGVMWLRDEPRVVLAAVVSTPFGLMTVATTHLSFVPGWSGAQLRRTVRALRQLPGPRVLLGDLNMTPGLAARLSGWTPLVRARTFPAQSPRFQLDHILGDGELGQVTSARAIRLPISDHQALVVTLTLKPS